jgi:hypothetical protein
VHISDSFAKFFHKRTRFSKKRIISPDFCLRNSHRPVNSQVSGEFGRSVLLQFGAVSAVEEAIVSALVMHEQVSSHDVDPVEEMRMRTWARRHYAPAEQRDGNWHPIVLDEMFRKDRESQIKPR